MPNCTNSCGFDFNKTIKKNSLDLSPVSVNTLQVNITKLCNQACVHCHVDASPKRKEQMSLEAVNKCLEILENNSCIENLDLTGGAPELNPHFDYFVLEAKKLNKHIMVRHNLTVTLDGNPVTGEEKSYLPEFFSNNSVEVISSLPYYQEYFTDKQRGKGVFEKDFKKELKDKFNIEFNQLFAITNMPINRFKKQLETLGGYEDYMNKLVNAFNPTAAEGIMCRNIISVSHDGKMYDCDFNQMLDIQLKFDDSPSTIFDFDLEKLLKRKIMFASHCFGCTAGSGSSCGGTTS